MVMKTFTHQKWCTGWYIALLKILIYWGTCISSRSILLVVGPPGVTAHCYRVHVPRFACWPSLHRPAVRHQSRHTYPTRDALDTITCENTNRLLAKVTSKHESRHRTLLQCVDMDCCVCSCWPTTRWTPDACMFFGETKYIVLHMNIYILSDYNQLFRQPYFELGYMTVYSVQSYRKLLILTNEL